MRGKRTTLIPLWVRPLLLFKRRVVFKTEPDNRGFVTETHQKSLWGVTYLLNTETYLPLGTDSKGREYRQYRHETMDAAGVQV